MKNDIKISESCLNQCVNNTYTFVLLLTGNTNSAETITVNIIVKEYLSHSNKICIIRCLKSAYQKCGKYDYISDDDYLMGRLSVLTFIERGLILLKYRYALSENSIGDIMKIKKSKVKPLTRQALEKLMRSGEDGSMFVFECGYSENIF